MKSAREKRTKIILNHVKNIKKSLKKKFGRLDEKRKQEREA